MKVAIIITMLLAATLTACDGSQIAKRHQGYVEGDYVLIAPEESGRIEEVFVRRGEQVTSGTPLFRIESDGAEARRREAAARLAGAEAQLANFMKAAKRPEELAVTMAEIKDAGAALKEADLEFKRRIKLLRKDFISESAVDEARTARDRARAKLEGRQKEFEVGRLPARADDIAAAKSNVEAARANLSYWDWRLKQRIVLAPQDGVVDDTLRYPGETASPSAPVISLLPPANRKIRFFIPEPERSSIKVGDRVGITCDGCPKGLTAEISFIATDAEFTPPIIFSVKSRQKLVFMVEARPIAHAERLYPGQPIDVALKEGAI